MKKLYSFIVVNLLCLSVLNAQGIFQLWGTTPIGGNDGTGVIFSTDAHGGNFTERQQFNSYNPGANPGAAEPVEYNGKFYGMTASGGSNGLGVIFEWDPATNNYTKKFDMDLAGGANPNGSLSLYAGRFYGMTLSGGSNNKGVIFEWDPATNVYTKKIDLSIADGCKPYGNLALHEGVFYGMTSEGGNNNVGVIFEWNPSTNAYVKKIDLEESTGCSPLGGLTFLDENFYGMTRKGGADNLGVIFEWDPVSNTYTDKVDLGFFSGCLPLGSLTIDGDHLFGMTSRFGPTIDGGTIFEWDPVDNIYTTRMEFGVGPSQTPVGSLIKANGVFYGMVSGGNHGFTVLPGRLFSWDPLTNDWGILHTLTKSTGFFPKGSMILANGKLYGMTSAGGSGNSGVIFEWNPTTDNYINKIDFNGSDGMFPMSALALNNGKAYGLTSNGGCDDRGVIYEWDRATGKITQKLDLTEQNGSDPSGNFVKYNGKFYGLNKRNPGFPNGQPGGIYEWDPSTNTYTEMAVFMNSEGNPTGTLVFNAGKFYGMTNECCPDCGEMIFEWDPATNIYTPKYSFTAADGNHPKGSLVYNDGKFYGMTEFGGINDAGVIFEWDPASNVYTKKIDMTIANGSNPEGNLVFKDGKFYGMTAFGGINDAGVIFEWDPPTNTYLKKIDLSVGNGSNPKGSLAFNDGKFYGMTSLGAANNKGVMFEWDPATNIYTKKKEFNGTDGGNAGASNDLSLHPAPVANGIAGTCVNFADITIDNSNNNRWVAIIDNRGDAVAEIKANGNNLGVIHSFAYINNTAVREDDLNRLYLDRNLTLVPEFEPPSNVDIRLYIKHSEYLALKNAVNSIGQSSGVSNIDDVGIYKNDNGCQPSVNGPIVPVYTIASDWETDHVLTANISTMSSFYFYSKSVGGPLAVSSLELNGKLSGDDALLTWKTNNEINAKSFELERSVDGSIFKHVTNVTAINQAGILTYNYIDKDIAMLVPVIYYRVKQVNLDGRFIYSRIIPLSLKKNHNVTIYPNPVVDNANLIISNNNREKVKLAVIDNTGRVVLQQTLDIASGITSRSVDVRSLAKGMYYLELKGETINERMKFIKQ